MNKKFIAVIGVIIAVTIMGLSMVRMYPTGRGTYEINDAELGGINIAGLAEWEDYPGHVERHEAAKLTDSQMYYWWCSSDFNCSLTATFPEPKEINEIHIHTCNIDENKYIPKTFEIQLNETDGFRTYKMETNNTYLTDYKLKLDVPKTVSGVKFANLLGNSFYGIGEYDLPCIEEIEIYKVRTVVANETVEEPVKVEMSFWQRIKWLIFGD